MTAANQVRRMSRKSLPDSHLKYHDNVAEGVSVCLPCVSGPPRFDMLENAGWRVMVTRGKKQATFTLKMWGASWWEVCSQRQITCRVVFLHLLDALHSIGAQPAAAAFQGLIRRMYMWYLLWIAYEA